MDAFKLTKIAVFNPQRLDDKTAKALFVIRTKLFQLLINELMEETKSSIAQNHLIIASRGMGKTTLLKRIQIEIKETDLYKKFIPILYQEEQYNITNLNDLWLNSLDKLADFMEQLGDKKFVAEIDAEIDKLSNIKNKKEAKIYDIFMEYCNRLNKRPVLLLDNIGLLFSRLDKDEQHELRKILIENKAPILIAANPTKVEEVLEYGAPFYDAFQIHYINKLTDKELFIVLNNLIKLTKSKELIESLQQNQARIRVINKLTGGNPRTAVMLFKLIVKGFSENLEEDLDAILDEVTPLYKARFEEELSKQAQIIMNAIANHWHPIGLKKLNELTGLPNNKLQPQLNRLVNAGWIEKSKPKGIKTLYEISERFFNFWYLMRQSNRRDKKQVIYLANFLESLYTHQTLQNKAQSLMNKEASNSGQILTRLAISQKLPPELKNQLISKAKNDLIHITDRKEKQRLEKLISELEQPYDKTTAESNISYFNQALKFQKNQKYDEAEKAYKKALEINHRFEYAWNNLGNLYQINLNKYDEAEKAFKKALEINPKSEYAWNNLGFLYQIHLNKYDEAEKAYKKALEINNRFECAWFGLGNLYQDYLNKYDEAEKAYKKALEINNRYENAWFGLGNLYKNYLNKYDEAEKAYKKALEINNRFEYAWFGLGNLYKNYLNEYDEAEKAYKKALEINNRFEYAWNCLGNLYQDHFKKYIEADKAYKKALEINPHSLMVKHNLVFLLRDKLNKTAKAKELFESIKEYKKQKDTYYLHKSLFALYDKKEPEAKTAIVKALEQIENRLPVETQDDWWRFAAVVIDLGYADWFLEILKNKSYDTILTPYFEAIKVFTLQGTEKEIYLNTKAVEIRETADFVHKKIKEYMK